MVSFKSLVLVLLFRDSASYSLRAAWERHLSFAKIAGYEPKSQVTDHNALDLDQAAMETLLAVGTTSSFTEAKAIYTEGGYSESYAVLTVSAGIPNALTAETKVTGLTAAGEQVAGTILEDTDSGATVVNVQYDTNPVQSTYVNCQVGGLGATANLVGCFASNGTITIDNVGAVSYSYNQETANKNGRTLQGFSLQAEEKMSKYADFQAFKAYYGHSAYGDKWVEAAFSGVQTSFTKGNADFSSYGFEGRTEAIKKGTVFLNVYMYVIRELEDALDDCDKQCGLTGCNDDPVFAWDEAAAFYTGSLEGVAGAGEGKFLHALADKRCINFKTCGSTGDSLEGVSKVNLDILHELKLGQQNLIAGKCSEARKQKERIAELMKVPMVQGTLRYAYILSSDPSAGEGDDAEGATFAAAVLPYVNACNEGDAQTIHDNMRTGSGSPDLASVKRALERNYKCMGITCDDVGGYYNDATSAYYDGTSPCTSSDSSKNTVGIAVGVSVAAVAVLGLGFFLIRRRRSEGVDHTMTKGSEAPVM